MILFLGPPGALIYILIEVVPDLGLLRHVYDAFGRRKRITQLEAVVLENPSAGNYEELGDLYLEEEKFARARRLRQGHLTAHDSQRPDLPSRCRGDSFERLCRGGQRPRVRDLARASSDSYRAIAPWRTRTPTRAVGQKRTACSSRRLRCRPCLRPT